MQAADWGQTTQIYRMPASIIQNNHHLPYPQKIFCSHAPHLTLAFYIMWPKQHFRVSNLYVMFHSWKTNLIFLFNPQVFCSEQQDISYHQGYYTSNIPTNSAPWIHRIGNYAHHYRKIRTEGRKQGAFTLLNPHIDIERHVFLYVPAKQYAP